MSASPSDVVDQALALTRYQRRLRLATGLLTTVLSAVVASGLLLALAALDAPWAARIGLLGLGVLATLVGAAWTVWLARTAPSAEHVAVLVEEQFPGLQDRFVTAVEIGLSERRLAWPQAMAGAGSSALTRRLAEQAAAAVSGLNLREAIDTLTVRRLGVGLAAAAVLLGTSTALFPSAWAGILAAAERPRRTLSESHEGAPQARPILGPSLADVALKLEYPAYTKQPPETRTADLGSVSAIVGTRVTITGSVSGEGVTAALQLGGKPQDLAIDASRRVVASFPLARDTTWQLLAEDRAGRRMDTPECRLRAVPDRTPRVALTDPGKNLALPEPRAVRLAYRAEDDWGLTGVTLEYRAPEQTQWQSVPLTTAGGRTISDAWSWDLRPLRLVAGQTVTYRLSTADNDTVSGPKTGRTPTYSVTIGAEAPNQAGASAPAAEQAAQRESEDLEDLEREAEDLGRQLDELIEAVDKGEMSDPERARRSAELNEAQRRVAEQADRVSRALAESEKQAEREGLPPQLQDKMRELHDLLQETMNKDLAEALKEVEQALQSMKLDDMQAGLQRARESQQDFAEQVRQAIELLKRARLERNLSRTADQAQKLASDQERLNQEREGLKPDQTDEARRQGEAQQEAKRREEALENSLQELTQEATPTDKDLAERLSQIAKQLQQSGAQQNMQEAAQKLQQGQPSQAAEPQQMALNDLKQAAGGLQQLQAQMSSGSQQQLSRAAQEMTRDALYLSREQERVMHSAENIDAFSGRSAAQGKAQRELVRRDQETLEGGTRQLGEKLAAMAKQTRLLDPSLARKADEVADKMDRAAREAAGGAGPQAVQAQREAMSGLNELAEELIRASESMQQSAQGAAMQGLMQQLQGLAQRQRSLNQQTQQKQGEGSTPRKQGGQGQLADEQQRVREALERLLARAGKPSGLPDQLGDVPAGMKDIEQDLRAERLGSQTAARQQEVLRRMLDAQRSVYKKDQQRRQRIAERPKPFRLPPSPPELTPRNPPPSRPDVTPGEDAQLPLDFEDVVRQYFRALAQMP